MHASNPLMSPESRITRKGQATIPAEIRKQLRLKPGDRVRWRVEQGEARVSRASVVAETAGKVTPRERPEDFHKLREEFEEGVAQDVMDSLRKEAK